VVTSIVQPSQWDGKPPGHSSSSDADLLRQLLAFGPTAWHDLHATGRSCERVLFAVGDLVAGGDFRVRVDPVVVEIEEGPDA
jgi:hypothetical protein